MKFMQRDVDKRLLFLVISLLMLLVIIVIYYEINLNGITDKYNKYQKIFGGLTADAMIEEFNRTSSLKESVRKYKEYLEKRYDEMDTINKNLKNEIENLKAELTLVKSQIEYQKAKEIGPTEHFRLFQNKNEEIANLKKAIKGICEKLFALNASDRDCLE